VTAEQEERPDPTLYSRISATKLRIQVNHRGTNEHDGLPMDEWLVKMWQQRGSLPFADHAHKQQRMRLTFWKGVGLHGNPPTLEEVLECLLDDASGLLNSETFEEWCGEYGYDDDSRRALTMFEAVKEQTDNLRTLLGGQETLEEWVWHTRRDE
jgi:hypothetical protein